jgi:hypothetical protein
MRFVPIKTPEQQGITKRGDDYLRTLLIQGAKSAVMSAHKRDDATSIAPQLRNPPVCGSNDFSEPQTQRSY